MKYKKVLAKAGAVLLALAFWQIIAMKLNQRILLVSPVAVAKRLLTIWQVQGFFASVGFTAGRIILGFLLGLLLGILLAFVSHRFSFMETLLWPWMITIKTVPVASFVIICLIWLSAKNLSVFISFLIVLPIIYQNMLTGLKQVDTKLLEMAKTFHFSKIAVFHYVVVPSVKPYLLSAANVTAGMAWKAGVAAEIIGTPNGSVGKMLYTAKIYLDTDDLLAWTVVLVVVSVLFEKLFMTGLHFLFRKTAEFSVFGSCKAKTRVGKTSKNAEKTKDKESGEEADIEVIGLRKTYGDRLVLDDIHMVLPARRVTAIMGSSGIGKTTLAGIMLGLVEKDCGEIRNLPDRIAVVFQEDRLCEDFTPVQNLLPVIGTSGVKSKEEIHRMVSDLEDLLADLGVSEGAKKKVCSYSGGEKRRIAILRALLYDAPMVILDEPMKGLDLANRQMILELIKKKTAHRTVLLITHNPEEADFLAETKIVLK